MRRRISPGMTAGAGRRRRGAIALEYILLCAFMAIALMSAFTYLRRTLEQGVVGISATAAWATANSVKEAMDAQGR